MRADSTIPPPFVIARKLMMLKLFASAIPMQAVLESAQTVARHAPYPFDARRGKRGFELSGKGWICRA
ncbi:hypothetical protein BSU04_40490 [Caballeronia sordidicola]|uniref:Uncharacterized protein n=1 Tax=Caballeronia sordidicola TaxID=196367 RepID=A0A226WPL3_CABSO|nr:hypothetical protein BSU04_40490 [Caballeronia sordidicola]